MLPGLNYTDLRGAVALVGGNWNNAALCGASTLYLNNAASNTNASVGACLSCEQPAA